jgi:hypothetical protein
VTLGLIGGLVLLAVGGLFADLAKQEQRMQAAAVVVPVALGAWMVGWEAGVQNVFWVRVATMAAAIAGGFGIGAFDFRWRHRGYTPLLLAVTVVGIFYTVPDTGEAVVLLGVALPIALLGWPRPLASVGWVGGFPVAGLLAWTVARGGYGRQSAIVGGLACLGLLVLEPLMRAFRQRGWSPLELVPPGWDFALLVGAAHLAIVFVASRVAGLQAITPMGAGGPVARGAVAWALEIVVSEMVGAFVIMAAMRVWAIRNGRAQRISHRDRPPLRGSDTGPRYG